MTNFPEDESVSEIDSNEFVGNNVGASQGMEIQSANGATGSIIRANLKGNYVHGNKLGFRFFNTATTSASITIKSTADRFEDNGMECSFNAGASTGATAIANGNVIKFDAYGDSFRNDHGPSPDGTPVASIYAGGGLSTTAANSTSNNRLEINLWGSFFLNNAGSDITAFGAYSYTPSLAGTNNNAGNVASAYVTITKERTYVYELATVQTRYNLTGIKDELEEESLKEILAGVLKLKEGKIGEIINKFLSNTLHWTWMIREGSLPENVNGRTQFTSEGVVTILDFDKLQNATNLSIGRTMIHEMIHAYLTLYFRYDSGKANKDYPAIPVAWMASEDPDLNKIQHDEIERSFINDIASALNEYAKTVGLNDIDEYVYTDLAWGGLDFQSSTQLTADIKKRIQNRLKAEQLNKQVDTEKPVVAFKLVKQIF